MKLRYVILIAFIYSLIFPSTVTANDLQWLAGAIASESFSQPFPAQCAVGTIVWHESLRRGITVEELVKDTNYLSGWRYGNDWHKQQYLSPDANFVLIANYAVSNVCDDYGARYFDGKYLVYKRLLNEDDAIQYYQQYECRPHPSWSLVVRLLQEIGGVCFYGW